MDTSAWFALADASDEWHQRARDAYPLLLKDGRLITTNLVLAETYTLMRYALGWSNAIAFLDLIKSSPRIEVTRADGETEDVALAILRQYRDQRFSYTDGVSFAVMKALSLEEAFTFDRHFATAGFRMI